MKRDAALQLLCRIMEMPIHMPHLQDKGIKLLQSDWGEAGPDHIRELISYTQYCQYSFGILRQVYNTVMVNLWDRFTDEDGLNLDASSAKKEALDEKYYDDVLTIFDVEFGFPIRDFLQDHRVWFENKLAVDADFSQSHFGMVIMHHFKNTAPVVAEPEKKKKGK